VSYPIALSERAFLGEIVTIERQVAGHYTQDLLEQKILEALRNGGKNPESLTPHDLMRSTTFIWVAANPFRNSLPSWTCIPVCDCWMSAAA